MQSISPVFTPDEVAFEKKIAEHQEEYFTVIGLPVTLQMIDRETGKATIVNPWGMAFRFRLSDEERAAVAAGKDLILTQLNFGNPITPMNVQFCGEGERPHFGETPALPVADPELKTFDDAISECEERERNNVIEMSGTMIDEARIPESVAHPSAADLDAVETERAIAERTQGDGFAE